MINKKAQVGDITYILVTITSIILVLIIAITVFNKVDTTLKTADLSTTESEKVFIDMGVSFSIFDKALPFILIGLVIALLVSSFFIPTHPIFLVMNIFGFLVLCFIGAVFNNLYLDVVATDAVNATLIQNTFPIAGFIMSKIPWVGAFLVLISTIIMYGKGRSERYE